ncbi:MAG: alpha/beta hydrolase [Edaphobacter sp.]|uniref:alpha/beta fold hydrolase n=1 Tax=Edaphobacter sp. TaxID=1934404 RepID=UPI0023833356|nr:alpha/beta hydrolase [Edaphobacter sp.]MDE1176087.1 alpha/beta hydrolase [Edaphobacter sp.]
MKLVLRGLGALLLLGIVGGAIFYAQPLWVSDQLLRFSLWRQGIQSEEIDAGGFRLHYFEAKPKQGAGTPLLLIHGLGARSEDWGRMIPALAASGFHVYAPDLPGYGRSSRPQNADYSIAMEEGAVDAFMQAVHLSRADVGGWSMGGWVAMKLALDHPERVDRLVIYDSAGIYFPATFGSDLFVPTDAAGVESLLHALTPMPRPMPGFVMRDVLRKISRGGWVISRSMASMANGRDLLDFRLHDIHQPTLVVWGAADRLIPLDVGRKIHNGIPNSVLNIVDGCGHLAPSECSRPVIEATEVFLKAQPPMQGGEKSYPAPY